MSSQTDLDQGGTAREWVKTYMGPTIGHVWTPQQNTLNITAAGTYNIDLSTSLVRVNVAGAVTVNLPASTNPTYGGAGTTQPNRFANLPVTIVDVGGNASANPITIQPAVGENIAGLSSIQITVNYGGYILSPSSTGGWNSILA